MDLAIRKIFDHIVVIAQNAFPSLSKLTQEIQARKVLILEIYSIRCLKPLNQLLTIEMSMEQGISMPAGFDLLLYSVVTWMVDTGASHHTSSYKEGCIVIKTDKGHIETVGISCLAVQSMHAMGNLGTLFDKYGRLGFKTTMKYMACNKNYFSCAVLPN